MNKLQGVDPSLVGSGESRARRDYSPWLITSLASLAIVTPAAASDFPPLVPTEAGQPRDPNTLVVFDQMAANPWAGAKAQADTFTLKPKLIRARDEAAIVAKTEIITTENRRGYVIKTVGTACLQQRRVGTKRWRNVGGSSATGCSDDSIPGAGSVTASISWGCRLSAKAPLREYRTRLPTHGAYFIVATRPTVRQYSKAGNDPTTIKVRCL